MRLQLNKEKLMESLDEKGWNIEDLAVNAGISFVHVYRVLNGNRNPGNEFIAGVSKAMGTPIEEYFYFTNDLPKGKESESD